jgi:putative glutathione S-transferase
VTLARFDVAYYFCFKTNRNRLADFDNLWNYAKDLYTIPAFKEATDFDSIKKGYLLGNHAHNPYNILPLGPDISIWNEPHNRDEKFGKRKFEY